MHPADRLRGAAGDGLEGRRIVLGITGSIAAVKCVELARELIRRGAEVRAVMTDAARGIVHEEAIAFATGRDVVTELTGDVEHLGLMGEDGWGDLLLLAPATANTLGKVAHGIGDTPVSATAMAALDRRPIVACPAMDARMADNPAVRDNRARLADLGVDVVASLRAEGKAKLAGIPAIVAHVERALGPVDLAGRRVLVVTGGTAEPVDAVRVLGNRSTGRTGFAVAEAAFRRGADVTVWTGRTEVEAPGHLPTRRFRTVDDLLEMVAEAGDAFDVAIVPAAIADYRPDARDGKLPSGRKDLRIDLAPTPKVLTALRDQVDVLVGFKLEADVTDAELLERAESRLKEHGLDAIVANRLEDLDAGTRRVFVLTPADRHEVAGSLATVADAILDRGVAGG